MNKEHKIHHNTLWLIKINLLAFSGNNAIKEVKIVDRFSESINRDSPNVYVHNCCHTPIITNDKEEVVQLIYLSYIL